MHAQWVDKANELAAQPYSIDILEDQTTTGRPVYVARIAELEGCMAQGDTIQEALRSLREAALDYITSLLEDGIPVPPPSIPVTAASNSTASASFSTETGPGDAHPAPFDHARLYEFHFTIR